ncbi:MAG TPA: ACP S-malonyltransferase [Candidatus Izemoplasmatales bacterium]|nr:ACP S-malonyltransferase [Candidatus Izemoplasmatales bacterium]
MKIALMFSGQGAQYKGMGQALVDRYPICRAIYERSEKISGMPIQEISFQDAERLNQTAHTQVCMYTMQAAILALLKAHDINTDMSMGLSLGEYGAYLHQGVYDFETGLNIVKKRAELMEKALHNRPGKMAAVIGMDIDVLENLVEESRDYITIANYNTPKQLVISGEIAALEQMTIKIKRDYKKRVIPLKTNGAFHSQLMSEAKEEFERFLKSIHLSAPKGFLYLNTTGRVFEKDIHHHMAKQLTHSVKFYQMVNQMVEDGVKVFIEIGPKRILSQLVKKMNHQVATMNIEDVESFENVRSYLEDKHGKLS